MTRAVSGPKRQCEVQQKARSQMKQEFKCDDQGEMKECAGCKLDIDREERSLKMTQPVLLQSFQDEMKITPDGASNTPAIPGSVLMEGDPSEHAPPTGTKWTQDMARRLPITIAKAKAELATKATKWGAKPIVENGKPLLTIQPITKTALGSHKTMTNRPFERVFALHFLWTDPRLASRSNRCRLA